MNAKMYSETEMNAAIDELGEMKGLYLRLLQKQIELTERLAVTVADVDFLKEQAFPSDLDRRCPPSCGEIAAHSLVAIAYGAPLAEQVLPMVASEYDDCIRAYGALPAFRRTADVSRALFLAGMATMEPAPAFCPAEVSK